MELILWRHADAEQAAENQADEARALTAKGRKQAQKMAEWLNRVLPENCTIVASPAVRTVQTVEALGRSYKTSPALATGSHAEEVLRAIDWPNNEAPVLIVGHQPTLGRIAALLIAGAAQDWTIRKANICWIERRAGDETGASYIKAMIGPDLVDK